MTLSDMTELMPSCDNSLAMSAAFGAVSALTGLDRVLPLPAEVHWAAAGGLADVYCKGWANVTLDADSLQCATAGFVGGMVVKYVVG